LLWREREREEERKLGGIHIGHGSTMEERLAEGGSGTWGHA
jgi:hypothetical protein